MTQEHWTERYLGIPYKVKGRDETGVDCWGLIYLIYIEMFGVELPLYTERYVDLRDPQGIHNIAEKVEEESITFGCTRVLRGQELFGDVILLPLEGMYTHVAMCIEGNLMIHALEGTEVTIEDYTTGKWLSRYQRAQIYRHPGVCT